MTKGRVGLAQLIQSAVDSIADAVAATTEVTQNAIRSKGENLRMIFIAFFRRFFFVHSSNA